MTAHDRLDRWSSREGPERGRGLPLEAVIVWVAPVVVACEILVTYARLPVRELYHVSGSGLVGGASRVLVFANFPVALIAIAVLALVVDTTRGWGGRLIASVAVILCAVVFWPGVVSQANLDARSVNALAALGVVLTLGLTLLAAGRHGTIIAGRRRGDWGRLAIAVVLLVVAAPWFAADLGFFLDRVPLLSELFDTGPLRPALPALPPFPPVVHHGHHHGMDGFLLVLSALLLSRALAGMRSRALRWALGAYLSLMFCYGLGNIANDFWTEQVFKRGWTTWQMPNVLEPSLSAGWAIIVIAATCLTLTAGKRAHDNAG
jgi:hypothetical protein